MIYTSPIKVAGLPLISVVFDNKAGMKPAVGVIAIGQYAYGFVSISQFGAGVICISQFGIGLVGVFQFGIAVWSIAQFGLNLLGGYGAKVLNFGHSL